MPYLGIGIGGEGRWPLPGMLRVAPAGFVRGDIALGTVAEGDRVGCLDPFRLAFSPLCGERIVAVGFLPAPKYWDTRRRKGETTGNPNLGLNRRASPRPYL
jgi:hypothetical protein